MHSFVHSVCSTANVYGHSDMRSKSSKNNQQHERAAGANEDLGRLAAGRAAKYTVCFQQVAMCKKASSTSRDLRTTKRDPTESGP